MTRYRVLREADQVLAYVEDDESSRHLQHLVHHSPGGFEYGYGGSGPSDLARSIVGDFLHTHNPPPAIYQPFKEEFVAKWDPQVFEHYVTEEEIDQWMVGKDFYNLIEAFGVGGGSE